MTMIDTTTADSGTRVFRPRELDGSLMSRMFRSRRKAAGELPYETEHPAPDFGDEIAAGLSRGEGRRGSHGFPYGAALDLQSLYAVAAAAGRTGVAEFSDEEIQEVESLRDAA